MTVETVISQILPILLMIVTGGFTVRVTNKHVGRHRARVAVRERIRDAEEDSRQFLKPEDLEYLATWDRILGIHTAKELEPSAADIVPVILPTPSRFRTSADTQDVAYMRTKEYRAKVLADTMENQKEARRQQESFEAARLRDDTAIEGMRARNRASELADEHFAEIVRLGEEHKTHGEAYSDAVKQFQQGKRDIERAAQSAELAREAASVSEYVTTVDRINAEIERLNDMRKQAEDYKQIQHERERKIRVELMQARHLTEGLRQEANHWRRVANDKALTNLNKPKPRPQRSSRGLTPRSMT